MTLSSESTTGRLLVATPSLGDPNFFRTVIFVLDHNEDGAIGVVLNRPSAISIEEAVPKWSDLAPRPAVVFTGGPVVRNVAICLAGVEPGAPVEGITLVGDAVGVVDLRLEPDELGRGLRGLRIFVGYAGWGSGQLESEISSGAWAVVPVESEDVLAKAPDRLWYLAAVRTGARIAWFASIN